MAMMMPERNGYRWQCTNPVVMKMGRLQMVMREPVLPGDEWNGKLKLVFRMSPYKNLLV